VLEEVSAQIIAAKAPLAKDCPQYVETSAQ
jgi:hypothetical protein